MSALRAAAAEERIDITQTHWRPHILAGWASRQETLYKAQNRTIAERKRPAKAFEPGQVKERERGKLILWLNSPYLGEKGTFPNPPIGYITMTGKTLGICAVKPSFNLFRGPGKILFISIEVPYLHISLPAGIITGLPSISATSMSRSRRAERTP